MSSLKPGAEVRVFGGSGRRDPGPPGGYPATVTRVARKYATATYTSGGGYEWTVEFDMETGWERNPVGTYARKVRTPMQVEEDQRRTDALAVIKAAGLEFRIGYPQDRLTLERIEALAGLVSEWKD